MPPWTLTYRSAGSVEIHDPRRGHLERRSAAPETPTANASEFHEATLLLDVEQENELSAAFMASDDFVGDEENFELLGTPRGREVLANESLASVTP